MKHVLLTASAILALICLPSCSSSPENMADKFCDARALAMDGQLDKASKIFDQIQEWGEHASELEKSEYRRLILNH